MRDWTEKYLAKYMDIEVKLIFSMRHSMLLVFDFEYGYHFYDSYPCIEHAIFGVFEKVV